MADLDEHDKKAVEELLCQAMDMVILEQSRAIKSATSLPPDLETRFQLLKESLHPASSPNTQARDNPSPFEKTVGAKDMPEKKVVKFQEHEERLKQRPENKSSSNVGRRYSAKRGCFSFSCWRSNIEGENFSETMKKARKEEEKIRREAEKVVQWVKHASSEMDKDLMHHFY